MHKALVQSLAPKVNKLFKIKYEQDKVTQVPKYKQMWRPSAAAHTCNAGSTEASHLKANQAGENKQKPLTLFLKRGSGSIWEKSDDFFFLGTGSFLLTYI